MPTHEPITSITVPQPQAPVALKDIPVRTVVTRPTPRLEAAPIRDQQVTEGSQQAAESAPPAESVKLAPQLTALARKEQALRQREQAFRAEQKAFEERKAEAEQYSQLKTKLASKDYSEAEKLGLNYEEYTKYLIDKQAGEDPTTQKFKALEEEIQALKKAKEDSAAQEYEEVVAEYKKEINQLIADSSDFPRTKKLGRQDAVLQLILDSWEEDATELTVAEAAKDVEAYLTALAKDLSLEEAKTEERKLPPPRPGARTLNQNMAAVGTTSQPLKSLRAMSDSERYAEARRRAVARLEGKI